MTKIKFELASSYSNNNQLQYFVQHISSIFHEQGICLYDKRNVIKQFNLDSSDLFSNIVVKRYKQPSFIQRVVYSFFRKSKAYRAFHNAKKLRQSEIDTPAEIAYLEEWENGLFKYGYYFSASDFASPIKDKLIDQDEFDKIMADDFAHFAVQLHQKGILHHDLNSTNVLYHPLQNHHYHFSVIDINRMNFIEGNISQKDCFENLTRFTGRLDLYEYVLKHYIKLRGWESDKLQEAIKIKMQHDESRRKRKALLRKLKPKKK